MLRVAQTMPHVFGALLIESPSLWIAEEKFLEELLAYEGPWPQVSGVTGPLNPQRPTLLMCLSA